MKLINLVLVLIIYSNLTFPQVIDSSLTIFPDTALTSQSDTSFTSSKQKKKSYDVDTVIYSAASDSLIFFVKENAPAPASGKSLNLTLKSLDPNFRSYLLVMVLFTLAMLFVAVRIFRTYLLMYGKRPGLGEIIRNLRSA